MAPRRPSIHGQHSTWWSTEMISTTTRLPDQVGPFVSAPFFSQLRSYNVWTYCSDGRSSIPAERSLKARPHDSGRHAAIGEGFPSGLLAPVCALRGLDLPAQARQPHRRIFSSWAGRVKIAILLRHLLSNREIEATFCLVTRILGPTRREPSGSAGVTRSWSPVRVVMQTFTA
jgi:hypothetical protein